MLVQTALSSAKFSVGLRY